MVTEAFIRPEQMMTEFSILYELFNFRNTTIATKHCFKLCKDYVVKTHSVTLKYSLSLQYVFTHFTLFTIHVNLFEFIPSFLHLRMSVTE